MRSSCDCQHRGGREREIEGEANSYDLAWELYFEERLTAQMASTLTGQRTARYLWLEQCGQCPACGQAPTLAAGWHMHHLRCRVYAGGDIVDNLVLLHANCHRQVHGEGLVVEKFASREGRLYRLEPYARKLACTVLGGESGGDDALLRDPSQLYAL